MPERVPDDDPDAAGRTSRRRVLGGIGALAGLPALGGVASAGGDDHDEGGEGAPAYSLSQGGACVPLAPLSGDRPVEELYDYRLPEKYVSDSNGAADPGDGPYYSSAGTRDLQRPDTSLLFLYDGPKGLSLVVVHGSVGGDDGDGGSATFDVTGVPEDASWVVKDDLYRAPESGDLADTNYDRWDVDGDDHRIDWTWAGRGTDGGALRDLGGEFELGIDPAFNDAATLAGEHYEGTVSDWQVLTAGSDGVRRVTLSLDDPVTIRSGACDEPLFDAEVGNLSVVVRRNRIFVRINGSTVSVSSAGVDVDLHEEWKESKGGVNVETGDGVDVDSDNVSVETGDGGVSVQSSSDTDVQTNGDADVNGDGVSVDAGDDEGVDVNVTEIFDDN